MNILHVTANLRLELGGVTRAVLDLATGAAGAGHSVTIACWDPGEAQIELASKPNPPTLAVIDAPSPRGSLTLDANMELGSEVEAADVVHLHTPWEPVNRVVGRMCERLDTPYILSIHGMLDDWSMAQRGLKKRIYLAFAGRRLLERAAFVHCTAGAELEQSKVWYPRGTGRVVPLVFDIEPYRDLPGPELARTAFDTDSAVPTVLFLSRIHVKKGVHVLVKAAAHLRDAGVECQTLIAGTGDATYEAAIRSQIEAMKLGDRVRLLGMVKGQEKVSLYQAADVFALPTSQENFGFVLPEALACGTPAITTKGVDIWPELEGSGSTVIVEQTHEAFAEAIAGLLVDNEKRSTMGERGRAWVLDYLEPSSVQRMYDAMYADAVG